MTNSLFRRSFVLDSLDLSQPMNGGEVISASGTKVTLHERGVLEIVPAQVTPETKHILVSTGVHGDETAPMELIDKIIEDVLTGFQPLKHRCLFVVAHPAATNAHTRFIDTNLNRLFDNKAYEESQELEIANWLKLLVDSFYHDTATTQRWHLDLHCAIRDSKHYSFAVSPKVRHATRSRELMSFLESAQIDAVLFSNAPSSTFSWFSAENYAAQALTMELGRVARYGDNDLDKLVGFDLALRDLISDGKPEHLPKKPINYRVSRTIVRLNDDFDFLFDDNVANFTAFKHGEVFGHDGDKPLMAKNEGESIVFPNRHVAVGQRAALMVCPVKIRYENDQVVYD
ncbi:succinylglutamate desuccinylase [Vibrio sonorensis]|uniref:succinylglutamate desuccinylase n=1 Tax=Vibrio sonorensis TaxID=1004316 RepID=UPI0008DA2FBC|nr:succinylglutamate desuccinylase [Vibrio sonorensis]